MGTVGFRLNIRVALVCGCSLGNIALECRVLDKGCSPLERRSFVEDVLQAWSSGWTSSMMLHSGHCLIMQSILHDGLKGLNSALSIVHCSYSRLSSGFVVQVLFCSSPFEAG